RTRLLLRPRLRRVPAEGRPRGAGARSRAADRRLAPPLGRPPVEPQLHVPSALELLEDHLVHAAARLDERRRHDRERATLLDVAGRAEEPLRRVERRGGPATRQDAAPRRRREGVGAGGARDPPPHDPPPLSPPP